MDSLWAESAYSTSRRSALTGLPAGSREISRWWSETAERCSVNHRTLPCKHSHSETPAEGRREAFIRPTHTRRPAHDSRIPPAGEKQPNQPVVAVPRHRSRRRRSCRSGIQHRNAGRSAVWLRQADRNHLLRRLPVGRIFPGLRLRAEAIRFAASRARSVTHAKIAVHAAASASHPSRRRCGRSSRRGFYQIRNWHKKP